MAIECHQAGTAAESLIHHSRAHAGPSLESWTAALCWAMLEESWPLHRAEMAMDYWSDTTNRLVWL